MNVNNVKFEASFGTASQLRASELPEIVFSGKSNVGKSSLINKFFNRKNLARVSAVPGKTTTINFFLVDGVRIADLPGYGYAKRSKGDVESWGNMIDDYLYNRPQLRKVMLLVDSRHKPSKDDLMMLDWIRASQPEDEGVIVIATKTDKLNKREFEENMDMLYNELALGEEDILVPFNTKDDEGKATVWDMIELMRA